MKKLQPNSQPPSELENRLDGLGRDLAGHPSRADSIMSQVAELESFAEQEVQLPSRSRWSGRAFKSMASIAVAACAIAAVTMLVSQPGTLYARTLDALSRASTIHITGWSTHVPRDWPLETPAENSGGKQDVEMWYWRSLDGTTLGYERCGPVTKSQVGGSLKEYQQDADLLYVAEGRRGDEGMRFATVARYLRQLKDGTQEDLGTRTEDGKQVRGVRVRRHNRVEEFWLAVDTDLPVLMTRKQSEDGKEDAFELRFSYDEAVPDAVASYEPPEASVTRYGGSHENVNLAWKLHVQTLLEDETPLEDDAAFGIVMRDGERSFENQWPLQTSNGKYWVLPVDRDKYEKIDIDHLLRLRVTKRGSDCSVASWRVEDRSLMEMTFPRCDLIYKDGTPWEEWFSFLLNEHGLEFTDVEEQRTYWIAQHDGRELKNWSEVLPPTPYEMRDGKPRYGLVAEGRGYLGHPVTLDRLFSGFNSMQNGNYKATHPIIVDETGLARAPEWDKELFPTYREYEEQVVSKFYVAADAVHFSKAESLQMARDWYESELGITFKEEKRPMTIHVIRKKK